MPAGAAREVGARAIVRTRLHWKAKGHDVGVQWILLEHAAGGWRVAGACEGELRAECFLAGELPASIEVGDLPESPAAEAWGRARIAARRADRLTGEADLSAVWPLPVLGVIPAHAAADRLILGQATVSDALVEAHEVLVRSLMSLGAGAMVVVTSAGAGEGKSTVAGNLALHAAKSGARALIVDADLRLPRLWQRLPGVESGPGLTDVLRGAVQLTRVIQQTEHAGLFALAAGAALHEPSGALSTKEARALFGSLAEWFDFVVVDTPPAGDFDDAAQLCCALGVPWALALVVEVEKTARAALIRTRERLDGWGVCPGGVVLNRVGGEGLEYAIVGSHVLASAGRHAVGVQVRRVGEQGGQVRWTVLECAADGSLGPLFHCQELTIEALLGEGNNREVL